MWCVGFNKWKHILPSPCWSEKACATPLKPPKILNALFFTLIILENKLLHSIISTNVIFIAKLPTKFKLSKSNLQWKFHVWHIVGQLIQNSKWRSKQARWKNIAQKVKVLIKKTQYNKSCKWVQEKYWIVDEKKNDTKQQKWEGAFDEVIDLMKGLKPELFAGNNDAIEMTEKHETVWVSDLNNIHTNLGIYFKMKQFPTLLN